MKSLGNRSAYGQQTESAQENDGILHFLLGILDYKNFLMCERYYKIPLCDLIPFNS